MRCLLHLPAVLAALAVVSLSGCSDGDDEANARARLLNVSSGYQSLDLYVNSDDSDSDSLKSSAVEFATLSGYTEVESGTYDIKFKRSGVTSTLLTLTDEKLADDSDATYVAYGPNGRFDVKEIGEDVEAPDNDGRAKLQALNLSEAGAVDIYLTDSDAALDDSSPLFAGVTADGSGMLTTDSGDYRLRITGADDTTDLRLDIPSITLQNKRVASLVLSETTGGVLVDALMLPQGSSLTQFTNTQARVRGAVGIGNGTRATLSIGGVSILSSQPVGVISSKYAQVAAGSVGVSLSVDGTAVTVENQTLAAGGDYTLLIWSDASGSRATLLTDNNHLPTDTGAAKIRLLNGFSVQGVPLTLNVDSSPAVEGIEVGNGSDYAEVDSGTGRQLEVYNSTTGTRVLLKEDVTLEASGVYTLLVVETADGPQSTLRKDR